ncbi:MAG: VIT1/CCC1 transporter family protein [Elusimicrobia bacterium]|nr:VIT1/CCC1 transporter family protein [Elusimicrobiota bacterium]
MARDWIRRLIRDAVFGAEDGMISTAGALTGIAAGSQSSEVVALSGLVIIAVESVSMAGGSYLSAKSHRQYLEHLLREERDQIELDPEGERREIRQMYGGRGFTPEEIAIIERRLFEDKELLLEDMAHKELGIIPRHFENPVENALAMGLAYMVGGSVPLLPYFLLPLKPAMVLSALAAGAALFGIGAAKGRVVRLSWFRSGVEMLVVGTAAGLIGFLVGRLGRDLIP